MYAGVRVLGLQVSVLDPVIIGNKAGGNRTMSLQSFPEEVAFTDSISQVLLRSLELTFEETEREFRRIEKEFVARVRDNEDDALEIKRRITSKILAAAHSHERSYEFCRAIWGELVQLGFMDREHKWIFTGIYARCCQMNGEFDAGLAVLEPLIAESEEWLKNTTLTPTLRAYWEHNLTTDYNLRDELKAGVRE